MPVPSLRGSSILRIVASPPFPSSLLTSYATFHFNLKIVLNASQVSMSSADDPERTFSRKDWSMLSASSTLV
jgi:hypothetical protein